MRITHMAITSISDFDGDGTVYRFGASLGGMGPELVIQADSGQHVTTILLSPADLGEFAAHTEAARKVLLKLWMERPEAL